MLTFIVVLQKNKKIYMALIYGFIYVYLYYGIIYGFNLDVGCEASFKTNKINNLVDLGTKFPCLVKI